MAFLPSANEVMFLHTCQEFCPRGGRWWCLGPHPGGKLRGLVGEVVSRPTPRVEVQGSDQGV